MKLLEKDIHEKQDTVVSLRRQLEDIKLINLDMYKKLQVGFAEVSANLVVLMFVHLSFREFILTLVGAVLYSK